MNYFLSSKTFFNLFSIPSLSSPQEASWLLCLSWGMNLSGTPTPSARMP